MEANQNPGEGAERIPDRRTPFSGDIRQLQWYFRTSLKKKTSDINMLQRKIEELSECLQQHITFCIEEKKQNVQASVNISQEFQKATKFMNKTKMLLDQHEKSFKNVISMQNQLNENMGRLGEKLEKGIERFDHKMHHPQEKTEIQDQLLRMQEQLNQQAQQIHEIEVQWLQPVQHQQKHQENWLHLHDQQIQQLNEVQSQANQEILRLNERCINVMQNEVRRVQETLESLTNQVVQQKAVLSNVAQTNDATAKHFEAHLKEVNDKLAVAEETHFFLQQKTQEKINHEQENLKRTLFETLFTCTKSEVSKIEKKILDSLEKLDREMKATVTNVNYQVTAEMAKEKERFRKEMFNYLNGLKCSETALKDRPSHDKDKDLRQKPESCESGNERYEKLTAVNFSPALVKNNQPITERGLQNDCTRKSETQTNFTIPAVRNNPVVSQHIRQQDISLLQNNTEITINFSAYRDNKGMEYSDYWRTHPQGYLLRARVEIFNRVCLFLGLCASDNDAVLLWPVTLQVHFFAKCREGSRENLQPLFAGPMKFKKPVPDQRDWKEMKSFSFEEFEEMRCTKNGTVVIVVEAHAQK